MRRIVMAVLGLLIGYPVFAFIGYWMIQLFSGNTFDRSMEADMTAVFAIGPLGAVVGLVAGLVLAGLKRRPEAAPPGENI
jgi:membrane associated rhomboid family serine protease